MANTDDSQRGLLSWISAAPESHAALDDGERTVSYGELAGRTAVLAGFLRSRGVEPGMPVGVLVRDRMTTVEAMLGILAAGAAFLPIEPGTPPARATVMISDGAAPWLLSTERDRELWEAVAAGLDAPLSVLELDRRTIFRSDGGHPRETSSWSEDGEAPTADAWDLDPDRLAYLVFTSGSTGEPRSIAGRLGGVDHFVRWQIETFGLSGVRGSQLALPAFDVFLRDVLTPLCSGGTVCIPADPGRLVEPASLVDWLSRLEVELVHCVPSVLRLILTEEDAGVRLPSLRWVFSAGEPLFSSDVAAWFDRFGDRAELINLYGPTETTMTKLFHPVVRADADGASVPIGRPMPGATAIVVDRRDRACPPRMIGEILIRTPHRSLGYFGRPDLTERAFVPNPFTNEAGDLVYRTGDLGRMHADGTFEFVGRLDQQVKIRGVRIELGEIESLLRRHPTVGDVAVVDRQGSGGEESAKYLCAYVVPAAEEELSVEGLRAHLGELLPQYMVPSGFVRMDELPRTLGGKLDRGRLPDPAARSRNGEDATAPRTPVEELVAQVWCELLGIDAVGVEESFFQLGGHSLLATQLIARLERTFGQTVNLRDFLERPTVEALSHAIGARLRGGEESGELLPVPREGDLPLSSAQRRQWFMEQLDRGSASFNLALSVRARGPLDRRAFAGALTALVERHEPLRTRFPSVDGEPVQRVEPLLPFTPCLVDLRGLRESVRDREARSSADALRRRRFDLEMGPVLRAALMALEPEEHLVILSMHHVATDAWSMEILMRELVELYEAALEGEAANLPELPIQYGDFAVWQTRNEREEAIARDLEYWLERLEGASSTIRLPMRRSEGAETGGASLRHGFEVSAELAERLRAVGVAEGATPFMVYLTAFFAALGALGGQEDLTVGVPVAGRDRPELQPLVGYFIQALALRVSLADHPTFRELTSRVRRRVLEAFVHQELPFERLVAELPADRRGIRYPLFDVVFNFVARGGRREVLEVRDLTLSRLASETRPARYPLTLYMWEPSEGGMNGEIVAHQGTFDADGVVEIVRVYRRVLEHMAHESDRSVRDLPLYRPTPVGGTDMSRKTDRPKKSIGPSRRPGGARRRSVRVPVGGLIEEAFLERLPDLPRVVRAKRPDLDLVEWANANREVVDRNLEQHGAVLFRGFSVPSVEHFFRFAGTVTSELVDYVEGSSPRLQMKDKVYTSTEYPPEEVVSMHNELSYAHRWPGRLLFYCDQPAEEGGETPIADSRRVLDAIPGSWRERFVEKGVRYVRNLRDGSGAGLSWQAVFETEDRQRVEAYCREGGIHFRWKDDGILWTSQNRPAVLRHPQSGELLWFNQVHQFHPSNLDQETAAALTEVVEEEGLPINAYYGDGTPLEPEALAAIREAYDRTKVMFPWRQGDVLLLDNMWVAHGRMPYSGPRRILVAMGDTFELRTNQTAGGPADAVRTEPATERAAG